MMSCGLQISVFLLGLFKQTFYLYFTTSHDSVLSYRSRQRPQSSIQQTLNEIRMENSLLAIMQITAGTQNSGTHTNRSNGGRRGVSCIKWPPYCRTARVDGLLISYSWEQHNMLNVFLTVHHELTIH